MVHANDIHELQRMITNLNEPERSCMVRVLNGLSEMQREVAKLKLEIKTLEEGKDDVAQ